MGKENKHLLFFTVKMILLCLLIPFEFVLAQVSFNNPLGSTEMTFTVLLVRVTQWVLGIAAFLAMLSLVVGGIRFIIAFGNDQGVAAAKKNITWAIVGVIVIILSYAIIGMVASMVGVNLNADT